jgi:hypothetical protein
MSTFVVNVISTKCGLPRKLPNSALLTDTYTSPLRAQHGAAKRER